MLTIEFFARDACDVAMDLLGKVLRHKVDSNWLSARIIETEAYYLEDKASHSSLGYSDKRKAMFMPPGTIYMYYARGNDSLNVSVGDKGDAVLIKAAYPYFDTQSPESTMGIMQKLNPGSKGQLRPVEKLCSGQTLLCKSLNLKLTKWNQQQFNQNEFYIDDVNAEPGKIIQATRLGIREDRDAHHLYRFIDFDFAKFSTRNPITSRTLVLDKDYFILEME